MKQIPDADCKMKLTLLSNGKVALQANNGKYLSRIAYSNDATDSLNRIQPAKSSIDHFSQFEIDYTADSDLFENVGAITLKADNGRYIAPHSGTIVKPLATEPHKYILFFAKNVAEIEYMYGIRV